eukprot:9498935-Pyramimonas_sp.AAC.2
MFRSVARARVAAWDRADSWDWPRPQVSWRGSAFEPGRPAVRLLFSLSRFCLQALGMWATAVFRPSLPPLVSFRFSSSLGGGENTAAAVAVRVRKACVAIDPCMLLQTLHAFIRCTPRAFLESACSLPP